MRRPIRTPPVPAKIYRHFAAATLVITLCIAMFADGENRQALTEQIAEQQSKADLAKLEKIALGNPGGVGLRASMQNNAAVGSWGVDNRLKVQNEYASPVAPAMVPVPKTRRRSAMPLPEARAGAVPVLPSGSSAQSGSGPGLEDASAGSAAAGSQRNADGIDPAALNRMLEQSRKRSGAPDEVA